MNKMNFLWALCVLTMISNGIAYSSSEPRANIESLMEQNMEMQTLLQEYVDESGSVGAAVGLIDQGKVQFFCYRKKSSDGDEAISEDSIFEIGSITKVFTTLALMDIVAKGEMQLDDPIELYLPGVKVPEKDGKKITLRHLATHYSGLPRMPDNFNPKNPSNPYVDYSVENLCEFIGHCTLQSAPGDQFEYSNVGMGLLGHILCLKSGKSYEQLISDTISKKLDMRNTGVSLTPEMQKQFVNGHHLRQVVGHWDLTEAVAGAGALRSNIKDMTRFLAANMGLLPLSITDLLKECHQQQFPAGPDTEIGLGWMISHSKDADVIWHNGGTGGFRTFMGFNPKTQKGVVVLSNSTEGWPDLFGLSILDPENYKKPSSDVALAADFDYLKLFEGSYEIVTPDSQRIEISIKFLDSKLMLIIPGVEMQLIPESYRVFSLKEVPGQKLQFIFDEKGKVAKAQMVLTNNTTAAEIIPKQ
jgi:CubicO group peptidase (beta-lactamase class C family)